MKRLEVVAAAVLHQGRVLAARRPVRSSKRELWEFPGGKVEPGETDIEALQREIEEELGVRIEVLEALGRSIIRLTGRQIDLRVYAARLIEGEPHPYVHLELRWLGPSELTDVNWAHADLPHLKRVAVLLEADLDTSAPSP